MACAKSAAWLGLALPFLAASPHRAAAASRRISAVNVIERHPAVAPRAGAQVAYVERWVKAVSLKPSH
jgi:hypothetical protein